MSLIQRPISSALRASLISTMKAHATGTGGGTGGRIMRITVFPVDKKNDFFHRNCCEGEYHIHQEVDPYNAKLNKYVGLGFIGVAGGLVASVAYVGFKMLRET